MELARKVIAIQNNIHDFGLPKAVVTLVSNILCT